jgi:hypothetical protein
MDGPAAATLLARKLQVWILASGMFLDFPHSMPFGFRRLAVDGLPGFGLNRLLALLDSLALRLQLRVVLPLLSLFVPRSSLTWPLALGRGSDEHPG